MRNFLPNPRYNHKKNPNANRENANWTMEAIRDMKKQAESGGVHLTGMGNDKPAFHLLGSFTTKRKPSHEPIN